MNFKAFDPISQLPRIWEWLTNINDWNTLEGWLARGVVWLAISVLTLKLFKFLLNEFLEIREKWEQAGLPLVHFTEKQVTKLRRRKQLCNTLRSDLGYLAKVESWNDQYFTDLEAEIEAEGTYYTSNFNRLIRRKSSGLRRESSLIKSIDRSAEQFLLLVGEPGSGKSVAMRHLAHQLTERAIRSNALDEKIPLYINLKELSPAPDDEPTPDFIKEFVLENVRRNDMDTVDYIREHWEEYREHGIWFFLFDSFDEIPAIMHAATGSSVVRKYSEAIRRFLTSMSSCRGIVASREFKEPRTLPWQKFRILPLTPKRQEKLVDNSFLKPDEKHLVRQHLVTYGGNIHHNPMFLTLLCRYIKDEKQPPINDYDLLFRHIKRLTRRDPDYIQKKYNLTPEDLLDGALFLASLFAERSELSLAPTQDDIAHALKVSGEATDNLENLLSALIDVKIGRCDVQEARPGDRRFTFAHRRYQEALFVHHLAQSLEDIAPHELLINSRWREYCVTLLQTQPIDVLLPILQTAENLLEESKQPMSIVEEFGGNLIYYDWENDPIVPLLWLLQEGFSRRINDIPESLSRKVQNVLQVRWYNGDEYDRKMVLELGGLLPQAQLTLNLIEAIQSGVPDVHGIALRKVAFLEKVPELLAHWARKRLRNEVLMSRRQRQLLQLYALSAYLTEQIEAATVFRRSRRLRNINIVHRVFLLFGTANVDNWLIKWLFSCTVVYSPFLILMNSHDLGLLLLVGLGPLLFLRSGILPNGIIDLIVGYFKGLGLQKDPPEYSMDIDGFILVLPLVLLWIIFFSQLIIKNFVAAGYILVGGIFYLYLPYRVLLFGIHKNDNAKLSRSDNAKLST